MQPTARSQYTPPNICIRAAYTASNGFDFDRTIILMGYLNIKYAFYLLSLMGSVSNVKELIWPMPDSEIDIGNIHLSVKAFFNQMSLQSPGEVERTARFLLAKSPPC